MFRPGWFAAACLAALSISLTTCPWARAEDAGEKELFSAIELRLKVRDVFQLGQVIARSQKALELGLSGGKKTFCEKMLVAALIERASEVAKRKLTPERRKLVLDDLQQAVKVDPTASEAYLAIAKIHLASGDKGAPKEAIAALTKAIDAEKKLGDNADVDLAVQALLLRARLSEDPKQQLADFNEALKFNPQNAEVLGTRGQMLFTQGKFKEALADFQAALKFEPKNAKLHTLSGLAWMAQNKADDALKSFNAALEIGPFAAALEPRARIYLLKGKNQEALSDLNKAIALEGASGRLLILRASAYHALKNDEKAAKDAESAVKLDPDDAEVTLQAGLVFYQIKKNDKAIETFGKLIEKDAKNAAALAGRADTYLQTGAHRKAVDDYGESLKHEGDNTHVLNNLAWVLATSPDDKVRDGRRAIDLAKKACELTSYKEAHIVSTLAAGYAETGDFAMAIKWSKKAVELGEKDVAEQLKKELASYEAKKPWREKFEEKE